MNRRCPDSAKNPKTKKPKVIEMAKRIERNNCEHGNCVRWSEDSLTRVRMNVGIEDGVAAMKKQCDLLTISSGGLSKPGVKLRIILLSLFDAKRSC